MIFITSGLSTAWLAEDAFIVFRTVENFVSGNGLRWNVSERVQAYSCPLWVMLLAAFYWITGELYFCSLGSALLLSLVSLLLLVRAGGCSPGTVAAVAVLCCSKSYVEFSTSGLENPLSHALTGIFLSIYFTSRQSALSRLRLLTLTASLGALNRLDLIVIFFPGVAKAVWDCGLRMQTLLNVVLFSAPVLAWEGFSLFYYGFLFPNPFYAKLAPYYDGAAQGQVQQGLRYLANSLLWDPVTLPAIAVSAACLATWRASKAAWPVFGALLYLAYVVMIGGDFMSGRLLSVPLYTALFCLAACCKKKERAAVAFCAASLAVIVASFAPRSPLGAGLNFGSARFEGVSPDGIADERAIFYPVTGLLPVVTKRLNELLWVFPVRGADEILPTDLSRAWIQNLVSGGLRDRAMLERQVHTLHMIGIRPFLGGPNHHYIDPLGLSDPFLARLPPLTGARTGHRFRIIPSGYLESVTSGENRLKDRDLGEYYNRLRYIVSGGLFDRARLIEIVKMNLGYYRHLLHRSN
ncbi:MAG: hypothetical protein J5J00_15940 [Deltaproteobacteria bacterium]|nr:hypothetical protein [Deltaproteobacteria bacterium]